MRTDQWEMALANCKKSETLPPGSGRCVKRSRTGSATQSIIRLLDLRPLLFCFLFSLGIAHSAFAKEDRGNIDPNREKVLVTIGGIDMDIPLGYFYEKTVWTKGAWPTPNKVRTINRDVVIVAHLVEMKPWSRELDADFKNSAGRTTRIWIRGESSPVWLENFLKYRTPTIEIDSSVATLPQLVTYKSKYAPNEILYLERLPATKPYFQISCGRRTTAAMCEVMFDFEKRVVVSYLIPVSRLADWQRLHAEVVSLLKKFKAP